MLRRALLGGCDYIAPLVLRQLGELANERIERRPQPTTATSGGSSWLHVS